MTVVTACATATVLQTQTGKGFGGGGVGVLYEGISAHVEKSPNEEQYGSADAVGAVNIAAPKASAMEPGRNLSIFIDPLF
jgi:hypothetical protein